MISSVTSGSNSAQALQQQSPLTEKNQAGGPAEEARKREAENVKRQAEQLVNGQNKPTTATVNTQGQTTGSIVNTTA